LFAGSSCLADIVRAAEDITISSGSTSTGGTWTSSLSGYVFTANANNAILGIGDLTSHISSENVRVSTGSSGSQAGTITVSNAVGSGFTWSSRLLTLDAYGSIIVGDSPTTSTTISATDTATLALTTGDGGTGQLSFNNGNITFQHTSEGLTINGSAYTLVKTLAALITDIAGTPSGLFALIQSHNASGDGTFSTAAIPTTFSGTFEGLGNTISHLTIVDSGTSGNQDGLFGQLSSTGSIRDIALSSESVTTTPTDGYTSNVGGLLALNAGGSLAGDSSAGSITIGCSSCVGGTDTFNFGGLVGENEGTIANSSSSASVTNAATAGSVGGLVGLSFGDSGTSAIISNSSASGSVTGSAGSDFDGGLVGYNDAGTIISSFASGGSVSCTSVDTAGGLVGYNDFDIAHESTSPKGLIESSYATIGVGSTTECYTEGGLVGYNGSGGIIGPDPSGPGTPVTSYATGAVQAALYGGGLVGDNGGIIKFAYALGSVTGDGGPLGGLVGEAEGNSAYGATISQSFSVGTVTDASAFANPTGGLIGIQYNFSAVDNSYSLGDVDTISSYTGGFVGLNVNPDPAMTNVSSVYEGGEVSYSSGLTCIGGFAGQNDIGGSSSVSLAYWNKSNNTTLSGAGCGISDNITGSTMLQSGVPSGFATTIWTYDPTGTINCGYPYLLLNAPPGGITCPSAARARPGGPKEKPAK